MMTDSIWFPLDLSTPVSALINPHLLIVVPKGAIVATFARVRRTDFGITKQVIEVSQWSSASFPRSLVRRIAEFSTIESIALAQGHTPERAFAVHQVKRRLFAAPRILVSKNWFTIEQALTALPPMLDPRLSAKAQVGEVQAEYGRLRSDISYRIENSALFDPTVATTSQFESALALWQSVSKRTPLEETQRRAVLVQLSFDTARNHAELLGFKHLPISAHPTARRAAAAARLAQSSQSPAEQAEAQRQALRLLSSLALHYLPTQRDFPRPIER